MIMISDRTAANDGMRKYTFDEHDGTLYEFDGNEERREGFPELMRDYAVGMGKCDPDLVDRFIRLFQDTIDPESYRTILAVGTELGNSMFGYGVLSENPERALILMYHECGLPFGGLVKEFYLGLTDHPADYEQIAKTGLQKTVSYQDIERISIGEKNGMESVDPELQPFFDQLSDGFVE